MVLGRFQGPIIRTGRRVPDDILFTLGTANNIALVLRSTSLAANTALTGVLVGTPVTSAIAATSLILSNITDGGDFLLAGNRGGNSEQYLFIDVSEGAIVISPRGTGTVGLGAAQRTRSRVLIAGTTAPSANNGEVLAVSGTLTAAVGFDAYGIAVDNTLAKAASGTHDQFVNLLVVAPTITAGASTLTNAYSVWISAAPTAGATENAALRVDALSLFGNMLRWRAGVGATGGQYEIGRNAGTTLQYNVPTGANHIFSVNGNTIYTLAAASFTFADAVDIVLNATTGTKLGTATTQKLGFFNSTPVVQPSATGETAGFTAGTGTAVNDASTFTGNVGATAYRLSDVVKHLKNLGLIAA